MDNKILYHGSDKIIEFPQLGFGNPKNDYGLGFYCTESLDLAKEWACTENQDGYANKYLLNMDGLTVMHLNEAPYHILNWLSILLKNRTFILSEGLPKEAREYLLNKFLPDYKTYDVIIGYRADDSYFSFANAFLNNTISLEQLRKAMMLGNLGEQIVLKSKHSFEQLSYLECIPAESSTYFSKRDIRDKEARDNFQKEKSKAKSADGIYMIDILRQKWTNNDARLS